MKRTAFDRFADRAAHYFGLNHREAANLLDALEEEGFELGRSRLGSDRWGEIAVDMLDDIIGTDIAGSAYDLEDGYDEWLEEGVEYELSAEYEEEPK